MAEKRTLSIEEALDNPELKLTKFEKHVIQSILKHKTISRDTQRESDDMRTFGERLSDQIAQVGGSWPFIITYIALMIAWIVLNSVVLAESGRSFDPYPYILLNLVLSMTAAIQAPIIMMSQNRQSEKDRLQATTDYEVNLKAELEIQRLHEKLDALHSGEWSDLVEVQERQIRLLEQLVNERDTKAQPGRSDKIARTRPA